MKTRTDLIIHCGFLLPAAYGDVLRHRSIAIKNGRILDIGSRESISQQYEAIEEVDASAQLVMPGLINAHTHAPMSRFRGLADDLPLMDWLNHYIFPAEKKLTADQVYWGTLLACCEMIRAGTTAFCDMYLFEDQVAEAAKTIGMRALVGEGIFQFPSTNYGAQVENGFAYTQELIAKWKGDPLIQVAVCPHAPYTCTPQILERSAWIAETNGVFLHTHLSETLREVEDIKAHTGLRPVQWLDSLGVLGPRTIAAHCVWLDEKDLDILATRDVVIAHCPESNMKLASGIAPVPAMLQRGIRVGLGTDGSASNNDLDLFGEMDSCAKLHKVHHLDPSLLPAAQVIAMTTLNGGHLFGTPQEQPGKIEPGHLADLIILDLDKPHWLPLHQIPSQIVYAAQATDVRHVIIHGRIVMRDRQITTVDEWEILRKFRYTGPISATSGQ